MTIPSHLVIIGVAAILAIVGYIFIFKSINESLELQHEINSRLPPDQKFEPVFWWLGTWQKFRKLQKQLLPESARLKRCRKFSVIGLTLLLSAMLVVAIAFGKFSR